MADKMKRFGVIFFLSVFLISCKCFYYTTPIRIQQAFIYKYDGKETGIDSLININGYYKANGYVNEKNDTIYHGGNMMFFKDGMFTQDMFSRNYYSKDISYLKDVPRFFQAVHQDDSLGISNPFYERPIWGRYLIFGDTIKLQYVIRPILYSSDPSWYAMEMWYKVIDKNMIQEIFTKPIGISNMEKMNYYEARKREHIILLPCTFVSTEILPSSNGWIKQKKWFWSNEKDWEEYMDSLKQDKKKKR